MTESRESEIALSGEQAFWRIDLSNALLLVSSLLLGLYIVARLIAFQWSPYSAETAMAGALGLLFVTAVWGIGAVYVRRAGRLPDSVVAALVLWVGLHIAGLLRSPYMGSAVPLATDVGIAVALLIAGFAIARAWPSFVAGALRLLVAAGVLEAVSGFWQKYHDLPLVRREAEGKSAEIEDILFTQMGQERLYSEEIFGTFGNANSFGGFLLVTMFLQAGIWMDARRRLSDSLRSCVLFHAGHALCFLVQGYGLYISGSKGAWVAGLAGVWFLLAQWMATTAVRARILRWVTGLGIVAVVAVLWLAAAGPLRALPFPLSLRVRFEYWQTAWGMIGEQPWLGVGLGGFSEAYPQYKTALGTETLLAHNDYLQLWAELGLLAPIAWLLLWFVVLRARPVETAAGQHTIQDVPVEGSRRLTNEQLRTHALGYLLLAGGVLGTLLMITCFGRMHGQYLYRFLTEAAGRDETFVGALAAVITPICFVGAFFLLSHPRAATLQVPGDRLWIGVRAAIGAILIHQLVDFDMTAQAIMAWLFLLGGFLLAQGRADERPGFLARASRWAPPVLAALLLWCAVLVPLFSGQNRDNALEDEKDLRTTQLRLQSIKLSDSERKELQETVQAVYEQMTLSRERAARWAPFDGTAALDLSLAYLQLMRNGQKEWQPPGRRELLSPRQLTAEQLERAKELRPRWHGARLVTGHVHLEWALDARRKGFEKEALEYLRKAESEYRESIRRYPLHPSGYLVLGDALLLQGKAKEAASAYLDAWAVDRRILDPNVRFVSIFHDPLPGCLVKHGRDPQVQERLSVELARPAFELDLAARRGLMVRQILVAAYRLLSSSRTGTPSPIDQFTSKIALIHACEGLADVAPDDGHAALFHALALRRFHQPEVGARQQAVRAKWEWAPWAMVAAAEQAWTASAAFALERERQRAEAPGRRAAELQATSVVRGSPDTLPQVYEEMRLRFGLPAAGAK